MRRKQPPPAPARIPARIELQVYGWEGPIEVYQDQPKTCVRCRAVFVFSAQDQQHYYEVLRFRTCAAPSTCPACRRLRRQARQARARLQALLTGAGPSTVHELAEASLLLAQLGRKQRAEELHRRAQNRLGGEPPPPEVSGLFAQYEVALGEQGLDVPVTNREGRSIAWLRSHPKDRARLRRGGG